MNGGVKLKDNIRHDPLYRVIDVTEEMNLLEGNFKSQFDRLKHINNLGIIPDVLEMAKHSKHEHYSGVMYQIESLIKIRNVDEKYIVPLKVSAIFLHISHLPFTYSTERSLLLASYFDEDVKEFVEKRVKKVLNTIEFDGEKSEKILNDLFSLYDYKHLYKYFSAFHVIKNWRRISRVGLKNDEKVTVLKNMVNKEGIGYKLLNCADKVDFVQRDSLYFGTARIDITPNHIYKDSKSSKSYFTDEIKLIDNNLDYLEERFYQNSDVRWFTGLYEKILVKMFLSKNFKKDVLFEINDFQMKKLITKDRLETNNGVDRWKLPNVWIDRMNDLFEKEIKFFHIFELPEIFFERQSSIDLEYKILKKSKKSKGLLDYPFKNGLLLTIDYVDSDPYFVHPYRKPFSINLFQRKIDSLDDKKIEFVEILKIFNEIRDYCSFCDIKRIETGICKQFSWNNSIRINNKPIIEALAKIIGDIVQKDNSAVSNLLKEIKKKKIFEKIVDENYHNFQQWRFIEYACTKEDEETRFRGYKTILRFLLSFPVFLKYTKINNFVNLIHEQLLNEYHKEADNVRGHFFEALWLIDRLLNGDGSKLLINGMIVVNPNKSKDKKDENEFDIIEIYIEEGKTKCNIYACSIADNYKSKNDEQLKKLAENIHNEYPDLYIKAFYVIPKNRAKNQWEPIKKEAGIAFKYG